MLLYWKMTKYYQFLYYPKSYNLTTVLATYYSNYLFKPEHSKTNEMSCAQRRLRSAWASAQSDQSLLCAQWVAKGPVLLHADSED